MEYLDSKEISYCTLFTVKASQDELEVYGSCMRHILSWCNDDSIYEISGCTRGELDAFASDIRNMLKKNVRDEILSDKYKGSGD